MSNSSLNLNKNAPASYSLSVPGPVFGSKSNFSLAIDSMKSKESGKRAVAVDEEMMMYNNNQCGKKCTPHCMYALKLNAELYNTYVVSEVVIHVLPLLMLNLANMYFYENISLWSLIAAAISVVFIVCNFFKLLFYVGCKGLNMNKFIL